MRKPSTPRKRCSECQKWFHPPVNCAAIKLTCSPACRRKRRAKQEKRRRRRNIQDSRADERDRQRRRREKLAEDREESQVPERDPAFSSEGAMSLAGDISILAEIIEKFLEKWEEMSLAGADPQLLGA
jgi:hypothetical protein